MWVKKGNERSYQEGFDSDELKHYVEDYAKRHGHEVEVKRLPGIAANGIHIHIKKKNDNV